MKILVIGACNIDIIGKSRKEIIKYESNIGTVDIALGGVAKNIATNLHYLGNDISFLTLIGNDHFSGIVEKNLNKIGLDYEKAFHQNVITPTYLSVSDNDGDMVVAINDMHSFEALNINHFISLSDYISSFDVLVFDTNLNENVLSYLIKEYADKLIFVDGVSQSKVIRLKKVLQNIDLLKVNQYELNAILNTTNCDIIKGVLNLHGLGVKNVVVSSSSKPIFFNDGDKVLQIKTEKIKEIKNTIGAGDALFSGIIHQIIRNKNLNDAIEFGKKVATKTLVVDDACNKEINKLVTL